MKTHYLRIPVSRWNDDQASLKNFQMPAATGALSDLAVVKASGKSEDYYLIPEGKPMPSARRLIVIVPPADFNNLEFALKVGRLSQWGKKEILFVALARDPEKDSLLRRRMTTLASYVRSPNIESSYKLLFVNNWPEALRDLLAVGDRVICLEDHLTTGRFFQNIPLSQQLITTLKIPVCVVQGIRLSPEGSWIDTGLREFLIWTGVILTLLAFLLVQARIQQAFPDTLGTIMEVASIVIEVLVLIRICSIGS